MVRQALSLFDSATTGKVTGFSAMKRSLNWMDQMNFSIIGMI
jgi:hypothetical protein